MERCFLFFAVNIFLGCDTQLLLFTDSSITKYCKIANLNQDLFHTYQYEIFVPNATSFVNGNFILTQWHGTADSTLLKDSTGCIARISLKDTQRLCKEYTCNKGK